MTLGEFFQMLGDHPTIIIFYLLAVPLTALLARLFAGDEGHLSPWKYLYSALIYLITVPGIFSITLNVYLFLFERQSIFDANIYSQVLPIISMIATLLIIHRCVPLEKIPGFDRLSGLIYIIAALLAIMWILDRTHIIAITFIPFHWVLLFIVIMLVLVRWGWSRIVA